MTFHKSNFGSLGERLPADRDGFVRCSRTRVAACYRALDRGREPPTWARRGANEAVARAELAIDDWRASR